MSYKLTRRDLIKLSGAFPLFGVAARGLAAQSDSTEPLAALPRLETLTPISLSNVKGLRTPEGYLVVKPGGEPLSFTVYAPSNLTDMAWRLRLIGEQDLDTTLLTPYDFQKFYDQIDDALDRKTTHHQTYSLMFAGTGEPRIQAAYMRVLWNFGAPPREYPMTVWVKKQDLQVLRGGRVGIEVTLFRKQPQRRIDDISGTPDATHFLDLSKGNGTEDWQQHRLPIPMDDGVACALFRIMGESYHGRVWLEDPRFVGSSEDSGTVVHEASADVTRVSSLPPFAPARPFEFPRNWLGTNLSRKEWMRFRLTLNGKEFYNSYFYQTGHQWPDQEVEVPDGFVRPGKNELTIELQQDHADQNHYMLREMQWLGNPGGRLEIVASPQLAAAGEEFCALVQTRVSDLHVGVDVMPSPGGRSASITALASEVDLRQPDLHLIKFRGEKPGPGATLRFRFGNEERRVTVERVVDRQEDGIVVGSGDLYWAAYHTDGLRKMFAWYLHNGIGNFVLFRHNSMDGAGTRYYDEAAWKYAIGLCKEAGMKYAFAGDQSDLPERDSYPPDELLQSPLYMGFQEYELDGWYDYANKDFRRNPLQVWTADLKNTFRLTERALQVDLYNRNPRHSRCPHPSDPRLATDTMLLYRYGSPYVAKNMREGAEYFLENVRNFRPGGGRHCGPSTLFKYFFQSGNFKYCAIESMYGPHEVLIGAQRGASLAYGQTRYGVEVCNQWSTTPHNEPQAFRRYFLSLATCYIHGVENIYQQDCLWRMEYLFTAEDRFSPACQGHLKVHQAFYRFTRAHSRRGRMRVPVGFLHGQYDGWTCCHPQEMVWGQAGPEWQAGPPEQSWELLKTFFPRSVLQLIYRNPCPHAPVGYFTGTPYGPVDIVPIEAGAKHLGEYRSLALLGWNTADAAQLERLIEYVENGGYLTLGLVHLSTELRRDQPPQPIVAPQVRKLLGLEIRGFKVSAGSYAGKEAQCEALAKLVAPGALQLGDVKLHEAVARVSDAGGTPVLVEHELGKGRVTFLNAAAYPGEASVSRLYEELLRSAATDSLATERGRVWVKGSDDVSFAVWDWDGAPISTIYLLNINWWSDQSEPAVAQLLWGSAEIPLSIDRDKIHLITVSGDWGVWVDDGETDVMAIEAEGKRAKIKLQGQGKTPLKVLHRTPPGKQPKLSGRSTNGPLKFVPSSVPGIWQTELLLNGPAEMTIEMSR